LTNYGSGDTHATIEISGHADTVSLQLAGPADLLLPAFVAVLRHNG
jgi:hypothetical protein